jgi:transcriptional regulator with XRE-family HTH domain
MLKNRIQEAMEAANLKPAELARKTGASTGAVSFWLNGQTKTLKAETAQAIQAATGFRTEYIISGKLPKRVEEAAGALVLASEPSTAYIQGIENPVEADAVHIPHYDTGGAMGHGLVLRDQPGVIRGWTVNEEWLAKNARNYTAAKNLVIVTGFGDSMRPIFQPGDPLLVDTGVVAVDFDGIYFFRVGDEGFVKRLQRIPGEGLLAISENKAYREWTVKPDMDFQVFGRVIKAWCGEDY